MTAVLVRKTLAIWSIVVLSGMMASCSSPVREAERAAAAAQDESIAATKQEQDAVQSYLSAVFQKMESHKHYPSIAAQSGLGGRVVLRFTVRRDGRVIDPQVVEVTGHKSFGDAALQTLRRIGQLPPFPDEIRQRELMVEVPIAYQRDDTEATGATRDLFYKWLMDEMTAAMDEAIAAMEQGSMLGAIAAMQPFGDKIRSLAEEGNAHAQDLLAELQRSYSEFMGAELGIDTDTLEVFRTFSGTETWHCFKLFDRNKVTPLFTLIRMRIDGEGFIGEVSVAGTSHMTHFQVAGLGRRWDWGCDEKTGCRYAFSISPDDTGTFYDFSVSDDGRAKPSQVFECQLSP